MNKKTLVSILEWGLISILVVAPLFYVREGVYPYILSKTLFFQGLVELVFGVWVVLAYSYTEFRPKRTPVAVAFGIFLLVLLVTSLLGIDFFRSFWSTQERMFGIFTWLHILALFIMLQSCAHALKWRRIIASSIGVAVIISCLAFAQIWHPNLLLYEAVGDRPGATFGNPTFLAGYLLLHIFLCLYVILKNLKNQTINKKENTILAVSSAIFIAAILNSQTRGDIAGLALGLVSTVCWFVLFPPHFPTLPKATRKIYALAVAILLISGSTFFFTRSASVWQHIPGVSRIASTSFAGNENVPRLAAWNAAWEGFKTKPLTGFGWENFNVVFNKYYNPKVLQAGYQETRFDKPHNAWLEYLVTGGVPLFLAYGGLFVVLAYISYKLDNRVLTGVVVGGIVAYHIRNSVVFETLGPVMMLAVITAYIDGVWWQKNSKQVSAQSIKQHELNPSWGVVVLCIGVCAIPAYVINYQSHLASYQQYYGVTNILKRKFPQAIENFHTANNTASPYQWNIQRDYARIMAETYFYNPDKITKEEASFAVSQFEQATKDHPNDAVTHGILIDLYNQIYDINPQEYGRLAEEHAARALELSPNRQEVYFSLSKTKTLQKDYKSALELLDKALVLAPNIPDSNFYYGIVAYADNQPQKGYEHIKRALELGRKWKNNNEPRVVANFFADSGHLDEAIELYKKALELKKDDQDARVKLGIAYFIKGDKENARITIVEAMKMFDITQSQSYPDLLPIMRALGLI